MVLKIWISSTVPCAPPASITSPTLKGWNKINITPEAKLAKDPCKAKPTAKEAAPTTAIKEDVSTPNLLKNSIVCCGPKTEKA